MEIKMKETLRDLRESAKKTCAEVAQALGVTANAISNYECGIRSISLEHVLILSELYGVSEKEIIQAQLNSCRRELIQQKEKPINHKRLYKVFRNMMQRCNNPNCPDYQHYGGRGISICAEWNEKNGFSNFAKWALANGYDEKAKYGECTLDRIDVNGNYCPDNCRWVNLYIQNNNRRVGLSSICRI